MANQRNSGNDKSGGEHRQAEDDIPQVGTGSRNLSRWQRLAEVRASMQADGGKASSGQLLGELGLAAKDAGVETTFSELERELMASKPENMGFGLSADELHGDQVVVVTSNVIAAAILETIVNANAQGTVNGAAQAVIAVNVNGAGS